MFFYFKIRTWRSMSDLKLLFNVVLSFIKTHKYYVWYCIYSLYNMMSTNVNVTVMNHHWNRMDIILQETFAFAMYISISCFAVIMCLVFSCWICLRCRKRTNSSNSRTLQVEDNMEMASANRGDSHGDVELYGPVNR